MKLNNIDLNKLHTFVAVARHNSLVRASRDLLVSPSAISQSLKSLETWLGQALFERIGRSLRLTEAGEKLFVTAAELEDKLSLTIDGIDAENEKQGTRELGGVIRVGIFLGFFRREFSQAIASFLKAYPSVRLKYVYSAPSEFEDLLLDGKLDIALSFQPLHKPRGLRARPLWEQELILVGQRQFRRAATSISEFENLPVVDYYSAPLLFSRWARHHFKKDLKFPRVRAFAASAQSVLDLLVEGVGIGVTPRDLAEPYLKDRRLCVVHEGRTALKDRIWLLEANKNKNVERISLLRQYFLTLANAMEQKTNK